MKKALSVFVTSILAMYLSAVDIHAGTNRAASTRARSGLAPTPPMGWNSWDSYGPSVTEREVKANADYMARHLKSHGWRYVVVDIQWYEPGAGAHGYRPNADLAMDKYGRLLPAPNRFPSSVGGRGFAPLAAYVHRLGLEFGIHIVRGIPRQAVRANTPVFGTRLHASDVANTESTCPWIDDMYGVRGDTPGGQAYYDSLAKLFAQWGVDYVKADDMSAFTFEPDRGADDARLSEIAALGRALTRCGRPIVLSLSPGPTSPHQVDLLKRSAQLWRISGDFWDRWEDLRRQFDLVEKWQPLTGPHGWADADMLPLGRIGIRAERGDDRMSRLTHDEQTTLMTLWAVFRSPLMMGGDLPSCDSFTLGLLTNDEVLRVNQRSVGNRELSRNGDQVVWVADAPAGRKRYLAVFNIGDRPQEIAVSLSAVGIGAMCRIRDLWTGGDVGVVDGEVRVSLSPHASKLFELSPVETGRPHREPPIPVPRA